MHAIFLTLYYFNRMCLVRIWSPEIKFSFSDRLIERSTARRRKRRKKRYASYSEFLDIFLLFATGF